MFNTRRVPYDNSIAGPPYSTAFPFLAVGGALAKPFFFTKLLNDFVRFVVEMFFCVRKTPPYYYSRYFSYQNKGQTMQNSALLFNYNMRNIALKVTAD